MCGDFELIINQVKGVYQTKHLWLPAYKNMALDLLGGFSKYDLTPIPREQNQITDALATLTSVFNIPTLPEKRYEIEVRHRLVIPNNIEHWQVFDHEKKVERFLLMSDEFANMNIDREYYNDEDEDIDTHSDGDTFQNQIAGRDIIQLNNNIILKGLVPLEKLFYENDMAKNPKITTSAEDVEDYNIGTEAELNMVKLSKTLSLEVKQDYINLLKYFWMFLRGATMI
jgi:hypothetical protein